MPESISKITSKDIERTFRKIDKEFAEYRQLMREQADMALSNQKQKDPPSTKGLIDYYPSSR